VSGAKVEDFEGRTHRPGKDRDILFCRKRYFEKSFIPLCVLNNFHLFGSYSK
jgi:hypothetical protein